MFLNVLDDGSGNHTDMIQWYGGSNAVVRGNLFKQTINGETQVMGAFDGTGGNLVEDNVVDVTGRNWGIELYSDDGSIVRHNTIVYHPASPCSWNLPCGISSALDRKTADDVGRNTQVYDNVATEILIGSGSTASRRDHNMVRQSAQSGDFIGTPTFVGGASPSTYEGYALATGSPGKGAASDGLDVGIRLGGTTPPPSDTTAPSAPTNLTATAVSSSQINLSWYASTDNVGVTGYKIFRGGTLLTTVTGASYSNTGLSSSTSYSYYVRSVDAAGKSLAIPTPRARRRRRVHQCPQPPSPRIPPPSRAVNLRRSPGAVRMHKAARVPALLQAVSPARPPSLRRSQRHIPSPAQAPEVHLPPQAQQ